MSAWTQLGAAVADYVSHPDYNDGRWAVYVAGRRKICSNKSTATAWANYLERRGFRCVTTGRVDPLPGFPRKVTDGDQD